MIRRAVFPDLLGQVRCIRLEAVIVASIGACFDPSLSVDARTTSMRGSGERAVSGVTSGATHLPRSGLVSCTPTACQVQAPADGASVSRLLRCLGYDGLVFGLAIDLVEVKVLVLSARQMRPRSLPARLRARSF